MSATMPCPRCMTDLHLISSQADAPGIYRVVPHACFRYLVAEHWQDGKVAAVWTSEAPGKTGPQDLARLHARDAEGGWEPPGDHGWTYRWHTDPEVVAQWT